MTEMPPSRAQPPPEGAAPAIPPPAAPPPDAIADAIPAPPPGPYPAAGQPVAPPPPGYAQPGYVQPGLPGYGAPGYGPPGYGAPGYGAMAALAWPSRGSAPGGVPLRPLGVGEILGGSFTLIRRNPAATIGLSLLSLVCIAAISALGFFLGIHSRAGWITGLTAIAIAVMGAFYLGALMNALGQAYLGRKPRLAAALAPRRSRPGWVFLSMIMIWLAAAALILPAILASNGWLAVPAVGLWLWLGVMVCLIIPVTVLERANSVRALARSWRLVWGSYWRTVGILILLWLITQGISMAISIPLQILGSVAVGLGGVGSASAPIAIVVMGVILLVALYSVILSIGAGVLVLIYADLRMRKEGLDLMLQPAAAELTGDEFAILVPGPRAGQAPS